ncbi:dTDP-4-dehydrorhamnose reductase family protein [Legionella parisiensis]|uniref:dTDP-4-dehydrorhamnose reductase n=1 Tax=Legionella parisiensis TaxID=45071 RepID=A0A1E5JM93_9GAMM|nr:SDR family oxidoreductase [Legionella parisiensis]KTD42639.1 dTDP-4-dehydrorhamnose reductase [Legionella parisiensis]OEH45632.1 dTDP-4-dehydrorhamnose reductase [Legionella parisiensis]STX71682.1 dTDP-4-dehydrorhamnose reductase [Legionella parisiensis]
MMNKKILVLGSTGMLGNAVFRFLSTNPQFRVFATMRHAQDKRFFENVLHDQIITNVDVLNNDALMDVFAKVNPDIVINCIGLIKQLAIAKDPLVTLPINAIFPHRLVKLCALSAARLIHVSTDCVFSGRKGMYKETDLSDAEDLYGKSKFIGELNDFSNAVTLRTSIIGHELNSNYALIDWFLSQQGSVKGYKKAIYSGLPTVELARVIAEFVLPNDNLSGLYHVSSDPIDKFTLLKLVAETYGKVIDIIPDDQLCIDRSLDSTRFKEASGYTPPSWPDLILKMKAFNRLNLDNNSHV